MTPARERTERREAGQARRRRARLGQRVDDAVDRDAVAGSAAEGSVELGRETARDREAAFPGIREVGDVEDGRWQRVGGEGRGIERVHREDELADHGIRGARERKRRGLHLPGERIDERLARAAAPVVENCEPDGDRHRHLEQIRADLDAELADGRVLGVRPEVRLSRKEVAAGCVVPNLTGESALGNDGAVQNAVRVENAQDQTAAREAHGDRSDRPRGCQDDRRGQRRDEKPALRGADTRCSMTSKPDADLSHPHAMPSAVSWSGASGRQP